MLASKLCRIPITSFVSGIGRPLNKPQLCMRTRTQQLASDSRSGATRRAQRTRISLEKLTTPAGETGKHKLNIYMNILVLKSMTEEQEFYSVLEIFKQYKHSKMF